ncbi:hypothetical protein H7F20_10445 [Robiginitalea sp. SC105]|nr:hypothetical protein [Robiginitalea sp. SC105]
MLFFLTALTLGGCSSVEEADDPVIGIWSRAAISDLPEGRTSVREEWIFNDAYLGRYHRYEGNELRIKTDFGWETDGNIYTIEYPGLDREADQVTIKQSQDNTQLLSLEGEVLALRE